MARRNQKYPLPWTAELVGVEEAAKLLNCSPGAVYRKNHRGMLSAAVVYLPGLRVGFRVAALMQIREQAAALRARAVARRAAKLRRRRAAKLRKRRAAKLRELRAAKRRERREQAVALRARAVERLAHKKLERRARVAALIAAQLRKVPTEQRAQVVADAMEIAQ